MAAKQSLFSTMIRALLRRPNEADAIVRVGAVAERQLRALEDQAETEQRAAAALALEAEAAESNAARLRQRIETLRSERQHMADEIEQAQQASASAFAAAVAAGDSAAEAAAMELPQAMRDAPTRLARMDAMLTALEAESGRADRTAAEKRSQVDLSRKETMKRRCAEAAIQFDEAANALLLAAARVYAAYETAGLIQPPQVQRLGVPYFSRERSVYAELTGAHEKPDHPPPVIDAVTVRAFVRAVKAEDDQPRQAGTEIPARTV